MIDSLSTWKLVGLCGHSKATGRTSAIVWEQAFGVSRGAIAERQKMGRHLWLFG